MLQLVHRAGLSIANTRAGETPQMLTVKYLLEVAGFVLMAAAAAILLHDLFRLYQQSNLILNDQPRPAAIDPRYRAAGRFTAIGLVCRKRRRRRRSSGSRRSFRTRQRS